MIGLQCLQWSFPGSEGAMRDSDDDDDFEEGYERDWPSRPPQRVRYSLLGVASLVIAVLTGLGLLLLFVITFAVMSSQRGEVDENSPAAIVVGLGFIAAFGACVAG